MDIPALSIAMAQTNLSSSAGLAVMKMALNTMEQSGEQMAEMLEQTNIDIKI